MERGRGRYVEGFVEGVDRRGWRCCDLAAAAAAGRLHADN